MRINTLLATLLCTGAICAGGSAYAQESSQDNAFALTGGASLAPVLEPFTLSLRGFDSLSDTPEVANADLSAPTRPVAGPKARSLSGGGIGWAAPSTGPGGNVPQ